MYEHDGRTFRCDNLIAGLARQAPMLVLAFLAIVPTILMVISSLKTKDEYMVNKIGIPRAPTLANYAEVLLTQNFSVWMRNSAILTISSVLLSLVLACLAAYAFATMEFRGKRVLFNANVSLMVFPPVLMLIPLFVFMSRLRLTNTYTGTTIIYVGLLLPFSIYLLSRFFEAIPRDLIDSARIDGCSDLKILTHIIVPLSRASIITLAAVNAMYVWNELLIVLVFMQSDRLKTLMVGVSLFSKYWSMDVPLIMAGVVLSTLPIVVLYVAGQQYFIRGLTAGSLR